MDTTTADIANPLDSVIALVLSAPPPTTHAIPFEATPIGHLGVMLAMGTLCWGKGAVRWLPFGSHGIVATPFKRWDGGLL